MDIDHLKVLILEDNQFDAELNITTLRQDISNVNPCIATDEKSFRKILSEFDPDIILSDYNLPTINGIEALKICIKLKPNTPFIIVTGSLDEETAVNCIKQGAWDYVLKEHLVRLNPAVKFALQYKQEIDQRKLAELKIIESEEMLKLVLDNVPLATYWKDSDLKYIGGNKSFLRDASLKKEKDLLGKTDYDLPWTKEESDFFHDWDRRVIEKNKPEHHIIESRHHSNGTISWYDTTRVPLHDEKGSVIGLLATAENITEKRDAQLALKISEERLKMAIDASNDGLWDWNIQTGEMYFSPRYFTMLGYEPDEFVQNITIHFKLVHPDDKARFEQYIRETVVNSTDTMEMEMRLRRKDGTYAWILVRGKVFEKSNDGAAVRIVGTNVDISQRKRHEDIQSVLFEIANSVISTRNLDELFESIQRSLNRVIDTKNCYIALYDRKSDTISLPFLRDEKDKFNEFPAGKTLTAYVISTEKSQLVNLDRVEELEKEGIIESVGSPSVSWLGVPLKIADKIIGVFVVQSYDHNILFTLDDVQILEFVSDQVALAIERKIDQDNIKSNQERQRRIFESSPDGLVVIDTEGTILDHNTNFGDMLRLTPRKVKIRNFFDFLADSDVIKIQNVLHYTLQSGYQKNIEFKMKRDNGSEFFAETSLGVIHSTEGIPDSFVIIVKNIDERKAYEINLKVAKEKAEESDRLKTAFLSNMSHEIRTPMNAIIGFAELLSVKELAGNEKTEFIQQINTGALSLMRLIDDIIDISKIEAGQIKINKTTFEVAPLFNDFTTLFNKNLLRQNKQHIKLVPDHNRINPCRQLHADEFRLRQIFTNLINNAIKFTDQGEIRFGIKSIVDGHMLLYVKDTGIGIAEDKQKIIFDRFRQGHETTNRFYGGTGLGLAISKHLVELMGGTINVASESGKGSEFIFTIPYTDTDIITTEERSIFEKTEYDFSGSTILIAEDDQSNFILLYEILKHTGAKIIRASDGTQAVELFKENPEISVVLMDIQLPVKNGYEATREIKEIRYVPVIAQTAYAISGEREKSLEAGCDDYISKPIRIGDLLYMLNKYIGQS